MDPDLISADPSLESTTANQQIEPHARAIAWMARIYLTLAILSGLFIILSLAVASIFPPDVDALKTAVLNGGVCSTLYIGLRRRASWLPCMLLLAATWSLVFAGAQIAEPAQNFTDVIAKLIFGALAAFFMVQILLFTRPSVRRMFKAGSIEIY